METATEIGTRIEVGLLTLLRRDTREGMYLHALAPYEGELDGVQYPTLSGIYWYGPISAAALGRRLGVDRSVVSRYAAQLEAAGLVCRQTDPVDKRASLLVITDRGHELVDDIRQQLAEAIADVVSDWPAGLAAAFAEGLERFTTEARASNRRR